MSYSYGPFICEKCGYTKWLSNGGYYTESSDIDASEKMISYYGNELFKFLDLQEKYDFSHDYGIFRCNKCKILQTGCVLKIRYWEKSQRTSKKRPIFRAKVTYSSAPITAFDIPPVCEQCGDMMAEEKASVICCPKCGAVDKVRFIVHD